MPCNTFIRYLCSNSCNLKGDSTLFAFLPNKNHKNPQLSKRHTTNAKPATLHITYNSTPGTQPIISNTTPASVATHATMICKCATASGGAEKSNIGCIYGGWLVKKKKKSAGGCRLRRKSAGSRELPFSLP